VCQVEIGAAEKHRHPTRSLRRLSIYNLSTRRKQSILRGVPTDGKRVIKYGKEGQEMLEDTVKKLRTKSGMTLKQISDKSNVPMSTLSRFFASPETATYQTLEAVVTAMGYTLSDVFESGKRDERLGWQEQHYIAMIAEKDKQIAEKTKAIRALAIFGAALTAIFIAILIYDICNPTVGWFRRQMEAIQTSWMI
jgi:transcriptional regulator with XRE-family HTH domain